MFRFTRYFYLALIPVFVFSVLSFRSLAQSNTYTVKWNAQPRTVQLSDFKKHAVIGFDGAVYNLKTTGVLPLFTCRVALQNGTPKITVQNAHYEPLTDASLVANDLQKISDQPVVSTEVTIENHKFYALVTVLPFRNGAAGVERLVGFDLNVQTDNAAKKPGQMRGNSYASSSVLATGKWYKMPVQQDGIYKLDKAYLQSLGISVGSINPQNIRIYGNGGGMLPETNNAPHYDDLVENAIYVAGESDGKFDDTDYVCFYGQSPHRWFYDATTQRYHHQTDIYSDYTYYFITTDLGPGKRVTQQSSSLSPNNTVTTFDEHLFHEADLTNLIQSGREWYGEQFQFNNDQTFNFGIPNVDASQPAFLKADFASHSTNASHAFTVKANGATVGSVSIAQVVGNDDPPYGNQGNVQQNFTLSSSNLDVEISYDNPAGDAIGYLNYIELNAHRQLTMTGNVMTFRNAASAHAGNVSDFHLSNASSKLVIWDVTDPANAAQQAYNLNGTVAQFTVATDTLHEFVAFNRNATLPAPQAGTAVANQNLHATGAVDYVMVTTADLKPAAQSLADFHSNLVTKIVTPQELYNEFSSGAQDISAIRNFMKMLYDRAAANGTAAPKYLLLLGDGSYDYKDRLSGNTNLVPTYESYNSLEPLSSFSCDDYYALLDDGEGNAMAAQSMDVAVGRIPVNTPDEAAAMVNKIKAYSSMSNAGSWQNVVTMVADDDGEPGGFEPDAEVICSTIATNHPVWNLDKIYIDAYHQISTPSGQRAPDVNTAIRNRIYNGTLIFDYLGHGGVNGLAHERILGVNDIGTWNNCTRMPLFVTGTCEFSKFDDPATHSVGELMMLEPSGGAIGLVTTVRTVFESGNQLLNVAFMQNALASVSGYYYPVSEALRLAKNASVGADVVNARKFTLLGDPAMTLRYPHEQVTTTAVNNHAVTTTDTLKALEKVTVHGKVTDQSGNTLTGFNGTVYPTVYDKPESVQTLGDQHTTKYTFHLQKNIIYRGKASVHNGLFAFTFVVPKDIQYKVDYGKISYFADGGSTDANGYGNMLVGGTADSTASDTKGPQIKLYMNSDKFVYGGITDENPTVFMKLSDDNGINTTGNGIGHDLTGILDANSQGEFVMNDFYEANLDDYTGGSVHYPLKNLATGRHTLDVKAWDVYNNSSTAETEFVVASSAKMALAHVLNYPNPFTTHTEFMFEHNMPGAMLDVKIEIYTVSGKLVKTIHENILSDNAVQGNGLCRSDASTASYRVDGIAWDGRDDFGDPIGKGVYVYRVNVRGDNGTSATRFEKLVVLK